MNTTECDEMSNFQVFVYNVKLCFSMMQVSNICVFNILLILVNKIAIKNPEYIFDLHVRQCAQDH